MLLYLPSQFEENRLPVLHSLMLAHPLATLITLHGVDIVADHIPMQTVPQPGTLGLLRGHVARANPVWRRHAQGTPALAVFQGPQAYVSPSLYPTKQETGAVVPTWDYAIVHAHGTLRFIEDAGWLHTLVSSLTDTHEATRPAAWKVGDAPEKYVAQMLQQIVGFELDITRLAGKWKVSQNRNAADRRGVIDGLRSAADAGSREIAELLAERDERAP